MAFLIWCMSPMQGSNLIYHKFVRPYFQKHEAVIDEAVKKGTERLAKLTDTALEKSNMTERKVLMHL